MAVMEVINKQLLFLMEHSFVFLRVADFTASEITCTYLKADVWENKCRNNKLFDEPLLEILGMATFTIYVQCP